MRFSERLELSEKYEKWLQEHEGVKDCPFNVISYLDTMGYLKQLKQNEEKIVKFENPMSKDDFKRIFENQSITDDFYKCMQRIEQEWNQYLNERALVENKTPSQVCDEIMNGYTSMTWGDIRKKWEGEADGRKE